MCFYCCIFYLHVHWVLEFGLSCFWFFFSAYLSTQKEKQKKKCSCFVSNLRLCTSQNWILTDLADLPLWWPCTAAGSIKFSETILPTSQRKVCFLIVLWIPSPSFLVGKTRKQLPLKLQEEMQNDRKWAWAKEISINATEVAFNTKVKFFRLKWEQIPDVLAWESVSPSCCYPVARSKPNLTTGNSLQTFFHQKTRDKPKQWNKHSIWSVFLSQPGTDKAVMSSPELFSQTQQKKKASQEQHVEQHKWNNASARPRANELPPEAAQGYDGGVEQIFSCSRISTSARQLRRRERTLSESRRLLPAGESRGRELVRLCRARYFLFHTRLYLLRHGSLASTAGFRCHLKFSPRSCCATLAAHSPPLTKTNARTEGRGEERPAGAPTGHGDRVTWTFN